jgi:large subunit ribosomal protein L29
MATAEELRQLTIDDLKRRADELRQSLFQDLLKMRTGTLDNPGERTQHRRDLARVLTILTQKMADQKAKPGPEKAKETEP